MSLPFLKAGRVARSRGGSKKIDELDQFADYHTSTLIHTWRLQKFTVCKLVASTIKYTHLSNMSLYLQFHVLFIEHPWVYLLNQISHYSLTCYLIGCWANINRFVSAFCVILGAVEIYWSREDRCISKGWVSSLAAHTWQYSPEILPGEAQMPYFWKYGFGVVKCQISVLYFKA